MVTTPDGRTLEVSVSGPADGPVLLYHHGTPGSSLVPIEIRAVAERRGLRLVSFARPGYAGSDRRPGRTIADVVDDVSVVLDSVDADTCLTAGWSGGGPHTLATGWGLPDRVRGVLVIAGVAPYDAAGLDFLGGMGEDNIEEFGAALAGETELRSMLDEFAPGLANATPEQIVADMSSLLPEVDKAVMTGEFGADLAAMFADALSGPDRVNGWIDDDLAFIRPWGFEVGDIRVPVSVWQGSADLMVPFAHGQWLAGNVPGVWAHLVEGDGHLSLMSHLDEMIDEFS